MDVFVAKLKLMTIPNSNYLSFIIVVAYIIEALPNNLLFIVKFVNVIHDENLIEAPETIANEACIALVNAMEKAGAKFCTRVPLKAEPAVATFWKK